MKTVWEKKINNENNNSLTQTVKLEVIVPQEKRI